MTTGVCNKCGESRDLVFAGWVCGGCSDRLDRQWAAVAATDWVLVSTSDGKASAVVDIMRALKETLAVKEEQNKIEAVAIPLRKAVMIPQRYIYRNATYPQIKLDWAADRPEGFCLGRAAAEEASQMKLLPAGLLEQLAAAVLRPATPEEIRHHDESLRKGRVYEVAFNASAKWGLDLEADGEPLDSRWDNAAKERAQRGALLEIRKELAQLGLLKGSGWEIEGLGASNADETLHSPRGPNSARGLAQVAGMATLKALLAHDVVGPLRHPEIYRRYRVSLPNGILFYGPPGCGKTYIGRSLAEELGWSFQYCRPSDVASPYIHDTVSRIRAVFSAAIEKAPSIVFIDEFEAFVPARSALAGHQQYKAEEVNEFLANLEGCAERKVLVIAATNEPEKIDLAVRRSGRFDKLIFIPPPDAEARQAMLEFHINGRPTEALLDTPGIAAILEGYSASDIKLLVDEAARMALKRPEPISTSTLLAVLGRVPPSITKDDIQRYSSFRSRGV